MHTAFLLVPKSVVRSLILEPMIRAYDICDFLCVTVIHFFRYGGLLVQFWLSEGLCIMHSLGWTSIFRMRKFGLKKLETILCMVQKVF